MTNYTIRFLLKDPHNRDPELLVARRQRLPVLAEVVLGGKKSGQLVEFLLDIVREHCVCLGQSSHRRVCDASDDRHQCVEVVYLPEVFGHVDKLYKNLSTFLGCRLVQNHALYPV